MKNIQQVFELFCSDDDLRPVFNKPFIHNGKVCATDAYSVIYTEEGKFEIETSSEHESPNVDRIIPENLHHPILFKISELEEQLSDKCPKIAEMTECEDECPECDGHGEVECNLGHDHDCDECDGTGFTDVPRPTGKKVIDPSCLIKMFDSVFFYRQIGRLIKACTLLEVDEVSKVYGQGREGYLFQSESISFIVMPTIESESAINIEL